MFDWIKKTWRETVSPILSKYIRPILTKIDDYASYIPEYSGIKQTIQQTGRQILEAVPEFIGRPASKFLQEVQGSYVPEKMMNELIPDKYKEQPVKKLKTEQYEKEM